MAFAFEEALKGRRDEAKELGEEGISDTEMPGEFCGDICGDICGSGGGSDSKRGEGESSARIGGCDTDKDIGEEEEDRGIEEAGEEEDTMVVAVAAERIEDTNREAPPLPLSPAPLLLIATEEASSLSRIVAVMLATPPSPAVTTAKLSDILLLAL